MKCFERLALAHLKDCLTPTPDPQQFAYRSNRSTEDAACTVLHSVLTHLNNNNTYVRILFVDFSSALNIVIPSRLTTKLGDLDINTSLCNWIMDFLTNRPQHVRSGHTCSTTITLNTGVPQGCVLSPFLYSLYTHDCKLVHGSNSKFADDTTVIGLIRNNDETAYREDVQYLSAWCTDNNLFLNASKKKELIVDFRKKKGSTHVPIHINRMAVERVSSFKFLATPSRRTCPGTQTPLAWSRRLTSTAWYGNCSVADHKALQRVGKTVQCITGTTLPAIEDIQRKCRLRRACSILKDSSHPEQRLFNLLPSGWPFRSLRTRTSRLRNSFFPTAVSLLNFAL
uniref:Reverse transcriptase domain-containing protein n=1 Tax=Cyprinus carpio carpio TaxID=630221 RepID=A0A9J8BGG6_CYPCA